MACIYLFFSSFLFFFFFFSKDIFSQFRQEIVWRGCVGVCVCVCTSGVCLCRAEDEDSCRNREGKLEKRMCSPRSVRNSSSECEMEIGKQRGGKKKKSRSHVGQLSLHSDRSDFYFCTCTFEYYQLQLKYPPGGSQNTCCIKT